VARANKEQLLDAYQRMLGIRLVELRLGRLFADGEVPGFIHLSVGQEAVAAAMGMVLRPDDTVASTHRGHGHALAKGIDMDDFFLELMAREEGICKGRGGSMHVANMSIGMLGANAIVGASIPIALGSALAHQVRKTDALAVAFFGDGAMAEGVLHESLNLAALWQLPLLFLCENNGWAEFSPTHKQFVAPLDKLSAAFSIPHAKVDGNDVLAVGAMGRAKETGYDVPGDVSITGFDDIELAKVCSPGLTTVHVPHRQMGTQAAQALVAMVAEGAPGQGQRLDTYVVLRGSLAPPRA